MNAERRIVRAPAVGKWTKFEQQHYAGYRVRMTGEFSTKRVKGIDMVDAWAGELLEGPLKGATIWLRPHEVEVIDDGEGEGEGTDGDHGDLPVVRGSADDHDEAMEGDLP